MYMLLAVLLSLLILFKTFKGVQLASVLNKHTDQSAIDHTIRKSLIRMWSNGALAVVVILAISKPDYLFRPIAEGAEYWQSLTIYSVLVSITVLLTITILGRYLANRLRINKDSSLAEKLNFHKPGRRRYGLLLALTAAINEELLFRAAIPLVFFMATDNLGIAALASICLFAFGHVYQGVGGVVSSTLGGILLLSLFVVSGSILAPMFLHFTVDLLALFVAPSLKAKLSDHTNAG